MTPHSDLIQSNQRRDRELRTLLEHQRDQILKSTQHRMREVRAEGDAEAGDVLDTADVTEADIQTDMELALLQMQRETLVKIEAALEELADGSYGHCVSCHGEIPTRRLQALPFAIRCRACEQTHEATAQTRSSGWHTPPDGVSAAA